MGTWVVPCVGRSMSSHTSPARILSARRSWSAHYQLPSPNHDRTGYVQAANERIEVHGSEGPVDYRSEYLDLHVGLGFPLT